MAVPATEIGERHAVSASDFCVEVMNLARESIWRKPFHHCVCIEKCAVNSLRRCMEHSVESDSVCVACCHNFLLFMDYWRTIAFAQGQNECGLTSVPTNTCTLLIVFVSFLAESDSFNSKSNRNQRNRP